MVPMPNELSKLHDIHLPPPISSWLLAPGWYILMSLCIGSAFFFLRGYLKTNQRKQLKKKGLKALSLIRIQHQQNPDSQLTSAAISELLRQIALICYSRDRVAGLQGEAWIQFLSETTHVDVGVAREALLYLPYQPSHSAKQTEDQLNQLFDIAQQWIQDQEFHHV